MSGTQAVYSRCGRSAPTVANHLSPSPRRYFEQLVSKGRELTQLDTARLGVHVKFCTDQITKVCVCVVVEESGRRVGGGEWDSLNALPSLRSFIFPLPPPRQADLHITLPSPPPSPPSQADLHIKSAEAEAADCEAKRSERERQRALEAGEREAQRQAKDASAAEVRGGTQGDVERGLRPLAPHSPHPLHRHSITPSQPPCPSPSCRR